MLHRAVWTCRSICGSELELAVWEALQAIPVGETKTYGALAEALSVPATAQEVGEACAANRLAVANPLSPRGEGRWFDLGISLGRALRCDQQPLCGGQRLPQSYRHGAARLWLR